MTVAGILCRHKLLIVEGTVYYSRTNVIILFALLIDDRGLININK